MSDSEKRPIRIIPVGEEYPRWEAETEALPETPATRERRAGNRRGTQGFRDRWAMFNDFVDGGMAGLTRAEMAVWFVIFRDTRNRSTQISMKHISNRAGCSVQSVGAAVKKLCSLKRLKRTVKGSIFGGASRYEIS